VFDDDHGTKDIEGTPMIDVAALFLTGLVSLFGQIVLLRELNVAFYGIELIYLIALGVWMLLTAVGALIGGRRPSAGRTAVLFLCFALFLPLGVVFLRASRLLLGGVPGAYLPFPRQMAALVIALLPAGLLSGLLFREAAGLHAERGRTLASAYGIESAGGLAGGLLATLCLRYGVQNLPLAVACGLIAVAAALFLFPGKRSRRGRVVAVALTAILIAILYQSPILDRRMTGWNHQGLLATRDSPYGRITATALAGQVSVFTNDALTFETGGTEAELFAHLTALQHPEPRRILVLGGDGTEPFANSSGTSRCGSTPSSSISNRLPFLGAISPRRSGRRLRTPPSASPGPIRGVF